jgi:hypothetical protein
MASDPSNDEALGREWIRQRLADYAHASHVKLERVMFTPVPRAFSEILVVRGHARRVTIEIPLTTLEHIAEDPHEQERMDASLQALLGRILES